MSVSKFNFTITIFLEGLGKVEGRWGKKWFWLLGFHVIQMNKNLDYFTV